jgi:tRNASer (uridine44-2'-O)-methyltransferase
MAATIPVRSGGDRKPTAGNSAPPYAFDPSPITTCPLAFPAPLQPLWKPVLQTPCDFAPSHLLQAVENMLRNPNLTSTCLYRAEIFYDSDQDATSFADLPALGGGLVAHLRRDVQPRGFQCVPQGWSLNRAVVRNLVPRNPSLDPFLVQTVLFAGRKSDGRNESLIVYVPHVDKEDDVPYYHPRVSAVAVLHSCSASDLDDPASPAAARPPGTLGLLYRFFSPAAAMSEDMPRRLQRTALNLLRITHKHSTGRATGYEKRVHHDAVIPQARFQDTYTRLKARYARTLMDAWAEVTDPAKHVFEDLGIAAFLIELWRDMYGDGAGGSRSRLGRGVARLRKYSGAKSRFPGFVDIGCGNGVLVFLLLSEGYDGRGFDARKRKSWSVFPESVQGRLQEMQLVPEILARHAVDEVDALRGDSKRRKEGGIHNGLFPEGTFIISNHADQLTPWTPLLAYISNCPFIAIPCCSHGLSGKLQRFYDAPPSMQSASNSSSTDTVDGSPANADTGSESSRKTSDTAGSLETESVKPPTPAHPPGPGPATGILAPRPKNQPSAYAGFAAHVMRLAERVGYAVESEMLRIPSTRNLCVIGRGFLDTGGASSFGKKRSDKESDGDESDGERLQAVEELVEEEVGDLDKAASDWVREVRGLSTAGVKGH